MCLDLVSRHGFGIEKSLVAILQFDDNYNKRLPFISDEKQESYGMNIAGYSSNQLLRLMFNNTSEFVFAQDANKRTVFINKPLSDFLETDDHAANSERITNAFKQPRFHSNSSAHLDSFDIDTDRLATIENANGELRTLRGKQKQLMLPNSQCFNVGIYTDLTTLNEVQSALEEQTKKLLDKNQTMEALNNVAVELLERHDLPSLLQSVVNNAAKIITADCSFVAMIHESGEYLETVAQKGIPEELSGKTLRPSDGVGGEVWRSGKTVTIKDYANHPLKLPGREFVKQASVVPIKIANEVVGIFGVAYKHFDREMDSHTDVLEMFAQLVAVAIENTTSHENTKSELVRTEAINDLSRAIHSSGGFMPMLDQVCIKLVSAFHASKASFYQYDANTGFTPLIAWEERQGKIQSADQADGDIASKSVATWCINNQKTAFIKRGVNDAREASEVHFLRNKMKLGSTVCVPLIHKNKSWGVMYAHRRMEHRDFNENDINLFNVIGSQTSIAIHRQDLLQRVQHQAYHDSLTDLPNRLMFETLLNKAVSSESAEKKRFAVLFLDLDEFKSVNDIHGHAIGDELLGKAALRLRACLNPADILSRMGGDEFAIIISDYKSRNGVIDTAEQMADAIARDFNLKNVRIQIGASIGINFYPDDAVTSSELLKNADIAMYNAKDKGKGFVSVFSKGDAEKYTQRLKIERDLKIAIRENQFELFYQPKVSTRTKSCNAVEALIRWNHPETGFVSPLNFIPVAEESGLIQPIGTWVIEQACRQGARWIRAGKAISIAINISAQQFSRADFVDTVLTLIKKHNFRPELLELEVTESVVMKDIEVVIERLKRLRKAGIRIAIDDFGTGYSSLKYLEDLPLDVLKIDKVFVDKLTTKSDSGSLVKTIVLMAKSFNLTTVAEGVETQFQEDQVTKLGCDYIQGYYYSKPVPGSELLATLNRINTHNIQKLVA